MGAKISLTDDKCRGDERVHEQRHGATKLECSVQRRSQMRTKELPKMTNPVSTEAANEQLSYSNEAHRICV